MAVEINQLQENKGKFKVAGRVIKMGEDYIYRKGTIEKGQNKGKQYKSVKIIVETSNTNTITTELFGMEAAQITIGKPKGKGQKGHDTKKIPFKDRFNIPKGYRSYGTNMSLEEEESKKADEEKGKKKYKRVTLHAFDAVDHLYDNLNDGDWIEVTGSIRYSEYEGNPQVQYGIESVKKIEAMDFDSPDFIEISSFEQEFVFESSSRGEDDRIYVNGYVIGYEGKTFNNAQFVVDENSGHKDIKKTAKAFEKSCNFGDVVTVFGLCLNKTEYIEVKDEEVEEIAGLFGGDKPEGLNKTTIKETAKELLIIGAENKTYKPEFYTEDQFIDQDSAQDEEDDNDLEEDDGDGAFGGGGHENIEDEDDDLPF